MHKFDSSNFAKLDAPERKLILPPQELLTILDVRPGDSVADIGAGTGYFSFPLSEKTADGTVFALDTSSQMRDILSSRIKDKGISNISVMQSEEYSLPLNDDSVSKAVLSLVLHEIEDKQLFLHEARRILKNNGILMIIEWNYEDSDKGPAKSERISPEALTELAARSGFSASEYRRFNDYFYVITARK